MVIWSTMRDAVGCAEITVDELMYGEDRWDDAGLDTVYQALMALISRRNGMVS